jgi:EpsI family protein
MHRSQILILVTLSTLLLAIAVNVFGEKVELGKAIPMQIADFPKIVGDWKDIKDLPPPESFSDVLPTAQVVERTYANKAGDQVDLMLLTATDYGDLHNPRACFPSQGWSLSDEKKLSIGEEHVNDMLAAVDSDQVEVLYWRPDFYQVPLPHSAFARKIYSLYINHYRKAEGNSLLVRVIGPSSQEGHVDLMNFTQAIQTPLRGLHYQNISE